MLFTGTAASGAGAWLQSVLAAKGLKTVSLLTRYPRLGTRVPALATIASSNVKAAI